MPDAGRTPSPVVTPEQVAVALWWLAAPDDTTAGEARERFAAVGVVDHDHARAVYEQITGMELRDA